MGSITKPKPQPDEIRYTRALDNWRLGLSRYLPRNHTAQTNGEPVLLLHGLAANASQFDLGLSGGFPSLANWLADRGYDVWAADLRGSGLSERPDSRSKREWNWSVDDFIKKDIPAIILYILENSKYDRLHWIGHSMGGIVLMSYAGLNGSPLVASGIAASGGLDYSGFSSHYDLIEPLKNLGRFVKHVPVGLFSKVIAPAFGRGADFIEKSFFYPKNMDSRARRMIVSSLQQDVSGEVLYQLASLFKTGGLESTDGLLRYASIAKNIKTPIFMIGGEKDRQCSPDVIAKNFDLMNHQRHKKMIFGKSYGHKEFYGHFDIFSGKNVDIEVFPEVLNWLKSNSLNTNQSRKKNTDNMLQSLTTSCI